MSDKALSNAMARRDDLAAQINEAQQRIDEWRREIAAVETFIAEWHRYAGLPVPAAFEEIDRSVIPAAPPPADTTPKKKRPSYRNPKKEAVADAACELIAERGEPIGRAELLRLLADRGLVIEGTEPDKVLSTMLWRMQDRVVRLKTGGYWLADRPYDPAGYVPPILAEMLQ